jgi:hypothetical protein
MVLTIDEKIFATARCAKHAAADGNGPWHPHGILLQMVTTQMQRHTTYACAAAGAWQNHLQSAQRYALWARLMPKPSLRVCAAVSGLGTGLRACRRIGLCIRIRSASGSSRLGMLRQT